jgi:hypothetical protein
VKGTIGRFGKGGRNRRGTTSLASAGARIILTGSSIAENASVGDLVGILSVVGGSGGYTFAMSPANTYFELDAVDSTRLEVKAALNYEAGSGPSQVISIQATGTGSPTRSFSINITNVLEVTLAALTLSASTIAENTAPATTIGAIQNGSSGSTITLTDDAGGRFAISGSNLVTGATNINREVDGTSINVTFRETHADGINSPRDTTLAVTITNVNEITLGALTVPGATVAENTGTGVTVGTISGRTTGSTLALQDDGSGRFALSGLNIVTTSTPTNFEAGASINITIRETITDGSNSPRDSVCAIAVTNVNEAPTVANAISDQVATESSAFSFQFASNVFADVDAGDTLTYSATKSDNSALPAWLTFTAGTRTFSGTPSSGDVGTLSVKVTATDGGALTVTDTFDIVVSAAGGGFVASLDFSDARNSQYLALV